MRKLVVDFSEADDIIRKSKNALEKLYDEGENVEGAIRELSSLGGSYGEENWILNQLYEEKREIEDECNRLEKFCQKYRSFVDKVEETDERLSKKFETDIENYCKKENIEIESDLDKFLDKVGTALDVVGMIPGIGDVADAINGVLCLARGDFWGAALSFVAVIPLIGDSFKLLKYTDEAAGLLKYGDEVVNIGKGILKEGTEKASKAFKKSLENLMESGGVKKFKNALSATLDTGREFIIRGKEGVDTALTKLGMPQVFNTLCTDGCFLGDTEIETENGLRNIKYIQIGEKVLTYNEEIGKIEYKEVVDKLERSTRNVCIIKTSNDTISSTTGHLFMVKDRWWVSSSSINVGDEIQTSNGTYEEVISKEIKLEGAINVTYNISLSENHTFFVGQDRILTHNTITKRECEKNLKKVLEGATQASEEMVTYRRVQGGTPPNASRTRINIDENGNVKIPNKKANLNVSTGNDEHAKYFLNKRGGSAEIVEYDIPKWLDDFINENAIPQKGYKSNPLNQGGTAPKIVDPTTPGNSYELPAPWIEWIEEYAKNGRITK